MGEEPGRAASACALGYSLLLVQQMLGRYKVKHPGLVPLYARARQIAVEIGHVTFEHVRREANARADRLANDAMDGSGA
jgi:ribonuclease HI